MASTPFPSRPVGPKGPKGNFGPAISVKVEGIKNLTDLAERFGINIEDAITSALTQVGDHLVERAKVVAPVKTGDLRKSIHTDGVKKTKGYFTIAVVSDLLYAADMHEYLFRTISNAPIYQLGPRSREEDAAFSGAEGGVGGGYIIRVLNTFAPAYLAIIERSITTALSKDGRTADLVRVRDSDLGPAKLRIRGRGGARVRQSRKVR